MIFFSAVNRLKTIVSLLMAAVWLPASSHSSLEHFELIHQDHVDHEVGSSGSHGQHTVNHDAADGKCALSSTHVNVSQPETVTIPFLFCAFALNWATEWNADLYLAGLPPPVTASQHLLHRWQFSLRTALPARASSLIS